MNVSLTPELNYWIDQKVQTGLYNSSSEVVREGLRLLIQKEALRESMLKDLRSELAIGLNQLDNNKSAIFDNSLLNKIKKDARGSM